MALEPLNSGKFKAQRQRVFKRDGYVCAACGTDEGELHIDHIIPRVKGGDHSLDNLQVLCKQCNLRKGTRLDAFFPSVVSTPPDFMQRLSPTRVVMPKTSPFLKQIEPE